MKNKILTLLGSCLLGTGTAFAQFTADFETDTTENWQVNIGPGSDGQGRVDFHFDYSTVGVPRSPNSKPGDGSYAMKLEANWDANVFSGLSVSPIGQSFEGNFVLKFDYWHNFIGPFPNKGSGGTMLSGAGIGTSGTSVEAATNARDAIAFEATGDGDSAFDYRVYPAGGRDD